MVSELPFSNPCGVLAPHSRPACSLGATMGHTAKLPYFVVVERDRAAPKGVTQVEPYDR